MQEKPFNKWGVILLKIQNFTEQTNLTDERKIIFGKPAIFYVIIAISKSKKVI